MKNRVILCACCFFALAMTLMPRSAMADVMELRLATWGPTSHYVAEARNAWIETVNDKAGDMIKIVDYPGGQLFGPGDMHRAVARGSIDLGLVLQPSMLGMIPMLQGVYLPFAFDSVDQIAAAYKGESLEIIESELEQRNMVLVYPSFLDGVQVFSNKKNIETIEDFEGLRILSASPMFSNIMRRLNAAPDTSIPQDEQYMALRRGVAEANANSTVGGYFQRSHEVAPYYTKIDMSYATILVCANKRTWERIPEEARKIMVAEGQKAAMRTLETGKAWEANFINELEKDGATIHIMDDEERRKIQEIAEPVWMEWAEEHGATAQRLLELSLGHLELDLETEE